MGVRIVIVSRYGNLVGIARRSINFHSSRRRHSPVYLKCIVIIIRSLNLLIASRKDNSDTYCYLEARVTWQALQILRFQK